MRKSDTALLLMNDGGNRNYHRARFALCKSYMRRQEKSWRGKFKTHGLMIVCNGVVYDQWGTL